MVLVTEKKQTQVKWRIKEMRGKKKFEQYQRKEVGVKSTNRFEMLNKET